MKRVVASIRAVVVFAAVFVALLGGGAAALLGTCGPFTDVAADSFCPFVLEIFYLGITAGTTATTYDPASNVTRLQMAAFLSRSVDGVLKRGSRRAAMRQFATPQVLVLPGLTTVGSNPNFVECDGADVWVSNLFGAAVSRVRASDGRLLETWTGATLGEGVLVALGRIFVAGGTSPGALYRIDPGQSAGAVTTVASNLGNNPVGIAFDGGHIWTANPIGGSVSIVTPGTTIPFNALTVTAGFNEPEGLAYDGANIWVTDILANTLHKLNGSGAILQTVTVGSSPTFLVFDGANLWVPNSGANSISVVRASNGAVLGTLTANGLNFPMSAAFDGQRVLVTNATNGVNTVSLWKAADLTPIGVFPVGAKAVSAASDGINFWLTLPDADKLARF